MYICGQWPVYLRIRILYGSASRLGGERRLRESELTDAMAEALVRSLQFAIMLLFFRAADGRIMRIYLPTNRSILKGRSRPENSADLRLTGHPGHSGYRLCSVSSADRGGNRHRRWCRKMSRRRCGNSRNSGGGSVKGTEGDEG